ncbi:uncharacterized protein LOC143512151 isoform X2 [Brachyhypopomus gauderio]|uniref:uncharacterized protein LOC143512151 isoform X2 n=1 Tax=Brachyhypopomus gauderio TaxID=698409 RepID=UPI004041F784
MAANVVAVRSFSSTEEEESVQKKKSSKCKICYMHVSFVKREKIQNFTSTRWNTYRHSLRQWLELRGECTDVAESFKHCLELDFEDIPDDAAFHPTCYRRFIDKREIERTKQRLVRETERDYSTTGTTPNKKLCLPISSSGPVLPSICIICKKGCKFVVACGRRQRETLIKAKTLTAGKLQQAAEVKDDQSILIHIKDRDCVALQVQYHKSCYRQYTWFLRGARAEKERKPTELHPDPELYLGCDRRPQRKRRNPARVSQTASTTTNLNEDADDCCVAQPLQPSGIDLSNVRCTSASQRHSGHTQWKYCTLLDHDYTKTATAVMAAEIDKENEALRQTFRELQHQLEELQLRRRFGIQRLAGSDEDIRFYTRFASYKHFQAFWKLVEPAVNTKMVRITSAQAASASSSEVSQPATKLPPIDELLLFLMHLSVGLPLQDLAQRFGIHRTTASRIISTWTHFLYILLGSQRLWIPPEVVRAHLPPEFAAFPDTQVVLDCTEIFCQTPSSLLLQSEVFSACKSHSSFKAMIGVAPHGAITFVSGLYAGSMSDREIFKLSGIINLLTPDMAIMVDKGFLVDNLAPCKVYRPAFFSRNTQMSREDVRQTKSIARLRVHVKRCISRVKENKLFDKAIPLSVCGSIKELFNVACFLVNYQNGPLVKA